MSHASQSDDAFARSYALDLLVPLRDLLTYERKELLFAEAVVFYRWYFAHYDDNEQVERYIETFEQLHPAISKLEPTLREACFITWFVSHEYHLLPMPKAKAKKKRQQPTND